MCVLDAGLDYFICLGITPQTWCQFIELSPCFHTYTCAFYAGLDGIAKPKTKSMTSLSAEIAKIPDSQFLTVSQIT